MQNIYFYYKASDFAIFLAKLIFELPDNNLSLKLGDSGISIFLEFSKE